MNYWIVLLFIFSIITGTFGVINLDVTFILMGIMGVGIGIILLREMRQNE